MSESTPEPMPKSDDAAGGTSPDTPASTYRTSLSRPREKTRPTWLLLSLLSHGFVGAISVAVVVKQPSPDSKRPENRTVASERVEKVAEHIRDLNAEELRAKVVAILGIKDEMDRILREDGAVYAEFGSEQAQRNPKQATSMLHSVHESLTEAAAAMGELQVAQASLAAVADDAGVTDIEALRSAEKRLRATTTDALMAAEKQMSDAMVELSWLSTPETVAQHRALIERLAALHGRVNQQSQLFESVRRKQKDRAEAQAKVAQLVAKFEANQADLQKAEEQLTQLTAATALQATAMDDANKLKTEAELAYTTAKKAVDDAKKQKAAAATIKPLEDVAKEAAKTLAKARNDQKKAETELAKAKRDQGSAESNMTRRLKPAAERTERELQTGRNAVAKVDAAIAEGMASWRAASGEAMAQAAPLANEQADLLAALEPVLLSQTVPTTIAPLVPTAIVEPSALRTMDMAALYSAADGLEAQVVNEYRTVRGVRLSMLRGIALNAAVDLIDAPKPARHVIDAMTLTHTPQDSTALEKQKSAIKDALAEGDKMVAYCQALLDSLREEMENVTETTGMNLVADQQTEDQQNQSKTQDQRDQSDADMPEPVTIEELKAVVKTAIDQGTDVKDSITKAVDAATKVELSELVTSKLKEVLEKAADASKTPPPPLTDTEVAEEVATETAVVETETEAQTEPAPENTVAETKPAETVTTEVTEATETTEADGTADADAVAVAKTAMKDAADQLFDEALVSTDKTTAAATKADDARARMEALLAKTHAMELASSETTARAVDLSALMKTDAATLMKTMNVAAALQPADGTPGDVELKAESSAGGSAGDAITSEMIQPYIRIPDKLPPLNEKTKGMLWGRKIVPRDGIPASWLIVDSWYVIGPWDNPNRANRDRKFPPENVVDLDASYLGKGNQELRWRFVQATTAWHSANVVPPNPEAYAIYYFATEIELEEAADLWVATGSDDKSRIWVNDLLIWESGPEHKNWRINEGFRKVHFNAGRNRILYRLENGHQGTAMSFLIRTEPWTE